MRDAPIDPTKPVMHAAAGSGDTIISIPQSQPLHPLLHEPGELSSGERIQDAQFKIRLANTEGRRSKASYLIKRRYAWRGYEASALSGTAANRITLAAFNDQNLVATITVGVDCEVGLGIEDLYPDEVKALRQTGSKLCEFTKLAVDNMVRSRAVLAAIFHIAYIYGHRIRQCTDLLIEVNPRHVKFYEAMLGFKKYGQERIDPRVNAPALLLRLELSYAETEIARLGGQAALADQTRLLYPLFFSAQEEQGIEGRLRSMD
jgi:hypothetical protein